MSSLLATYLMSTAPGYAQPEKLAERYFEEGHRLYEQEDYQQALSYFNRALRIDSQFTAALNNKGNVFYRTNKPQKALKWYNKAIASDSSFSTAFFNKGYLLMKQDELANALFTFNRAISLNPDNASTWSHLGWVKYKMMMYEEAESEQNKALSLEPKYPLALYRRGKIREQLREYDKAYADFSACLEQTEYPKARYERARIASYRDNLEAAVKDLDVAVKKKNAYLKAHLLRGIMHSKLKNYQKATEDFNFVLQQDQKNGKAWYNLGIILFKQDHKNRARKAWKKGAAYGHKGSKVMLKKYFE